MSHQGENKAGHILAITGAALQLAPAVGVLAGMFRLQASVDQLDFANAADADALMGRLLEAQDQMSHAFDLTLWSVGLAAIGLIPFILAITRFRYRKAWAFWFCCVYGACAVFLLPPLGAFLLIYGLLYRREFLPLPAAPAPLDATQPS